MPQLAILVDGVAAKTIALDKVKITIGRSPASDIHIDDVSVSTNHAEIVVATNPLLDGHNDIYVEDLQSRNGTRVNGNLIHRCLLAPNDVITIGFNKFKLLDDRSVENESTVLIVME